MAAPDSRHARSTRAVAERQGPGHAALGAAVFAAGWRARVLRKNRKNLYEFLKCFEKSKTKLTTNLEFVF